MIVLSLDSNYILSKMYATTPANIIHTEPYVGRTFQKEVH